MACDDCERHERRTSPERLDERVRRLETKTHIGDVVATLVLFVFGMWALLRLTEKAGITLDG